MKFIKPPETLIKIDTLLYKEWSDHKKKSWDTKGNIVYVVCVRCIYIYMRCVCVCVCVCACVSTATTPHPKNQLRPRHTVSHQAHVCVCVCVCVSRTRHMWTQEGVSQVAGVWCTLRSTVTCSCFTSNYKVLQGWLPGYCESKCVDRPKQKHGLIVSSIQL